MHEFSTPTISTPVPHVPDDLTLPQFFLDFPHPARPVRPQGVPCLIEDHSGRPIGFDELKYRCSGLANALSIKWNIGEGDVVCLFSPNHVDYPVSIWATHRIGAIVTPANPGYTADELVHQLSTTKAAVVLCFVEFLPTALAAAKVVGLSPDRIAVIEASASSPYKGKHETLSKLVEFGANKPPNYVERKLRPGEAKTKVAFYCFSSGTTGKPKAVIIPHYSFTANILQTAAHYAITDPTVKKKHMNPGDVAVGVLPFFHIYGLVVVLHYMLFSGVTLVVVPKFNFTQFLESVTKYKITHLFLVPPQIVLLCKHPATKKHDLSRVKFVVSGAAPLSGELLTGLRKLLPDAAIGQGYGMTETCTTVAILGGRQSMSTPGAAGQIIPGVVARVVRPDGTLCKEGEQGELVVTGPSMALGYLNNEVATKESFVDGWVRTGDEVIIRNSEVFVVDRLKEIIKVKGFQVAPAELEGHLLLHPTVSDACVVGIPDDYAGEIPLAYVVLNEASSKRVAGKPTEGEKIKAELMKYVADNKIAYKRLAGGVVFTDAIPKNASGKILRRVLRDKAKKEHGGERARL
ncbi:amp dependent CoA ligase [Roridomyces roridus]|uniref:Amp dependent CoA ligase n=1 Tax=Roridomyces roridus TaxID=1738132 RepID=A0AAD7FLK4_9AGAR|nr:amp dependent CoA ligase [Roridomyces roridus]